MSAGIALKDYAIDRIVTTSLARATETAAIIADVIKCPIVETDDRLLEYDMGDLTGTPNRAITSAELIAAAGAEDPNAFNARVLSALRDYAGTQHNILLVSHAGVGRIIEANRHHTPAEKFYDFPAPPNAKVIELDLDWLTAKK